MKEISNAIPMLKLSVFSLGILAVISCNDSPKSTISNQEIKELVSQNIEENTTTRQGSIQRPFPSIPEEFESFQFDPTQGVEWKSESGSIVRIPPNILVDANGQAVTEKVTLKYNEMRDMVDVFLSGIPMTYDSAGSTQHFESAGMFELKAESMGEPVFIKNGEEVIVDFASDVEGNQFNMYRFNEAEKRWEYLYKDDALNLSESSKAKDRSLNELKRISVKLVEKKNALAALKPKKAKSNDIVIKVAFDEEDHPQLAAYENLEFKILDKSSFDPKYPAMDWNSVDITRTPDSTYQLVFKNFKMEKSFECEPVFRGKNYEEALAKFEQNHQESQAIIKKLEEEEKERLANLKKRQEAYEAARKQDSIRRSYQNETYQSEANVARQFRLNSFGVYNSDSPCFYPKEQILMAKLVYKNLPDSNLKHGNTFLVERGRNLMFTYWDLLDFGYNPQKNNLLWTVTSDNKLALFKGTDFNQLKGLQKGSNVSLPMEIIDVEFTSEDQIRHYLEI